MFAEILAYCEQVKTPCLAAQSFSRTKKIAGSSEGRRQPGVSSCLHRRSSGTPSPSGSSTGRPACGVNRDLLIAGGSIHDIGKIYEFSFERIVEYSDPGRLVGHIVIGVEMVDAKIAAIPDFPEQTAMELRHLILSHHVCPRIRLAQAPQDAGGPDRSLYGRP